MRLRIILLVIAISSMVLISFLVPLALVLRTFAADRAVSSATVQAQWMAPLVATLDATSLKLAVAQVNGEDRNQPVTVFLPDGRVLGRPAARSAGVRLAAKGRSFATQTRGGVEVLVAVQGLPRGTAVIRTFVPGPELRAGVVRAWLLLCAVGLGLLVLSVAVADQLARSLVRPLGDLARASDLLAAGHLASRAQVTGPPEVRQVSAGLNRLAERIGALLAHERETVADLSHRLRTPLTALRINAESLHDAAEMEQLLTDVAGLERTVSEIIREARRPTAEGSRVACDASEVVARRAAFWQPLAEDQDRRMTVEVIPGPVPVGTSGDDLAACTDILLENVFAHTPEGLAFSVRVSLRASGGAWLVVSDQGPGFAGPDAARRGMSTGGSTGLGLDIARRIAEISGGSLTVGRSATGGGSVTVGLGPPAGSAQPDRRHRRARPHLTRGRRAAGNAGLPGDPPPWAAGVTQGVNQGMRRGRPLR
jgi:signal transduction histidine kinase